MSSYIAPIISSIILLIVFKLLAKLFPSDHSSYNSNKSFYELEKKYNKIKNLMVLGYIILSVGFTFSVYFGFTEISNKMLANNLDSIILVAPEKVAWILSAMFTGMLCASICIFLISMVKLEENWYEFLAFLNMFYNQKFNFNYIKISRYLFVFLVIIIGIFNTMLFDCYTSFEKNNIKINEILSFGAETYRYNQVKEIRSIEKFKAPNGNIKNVAYFTIIYDDGYKWSSRNKGLKDEAQNEKIINLVSNKSGIKPIFLEFDFD